MHGVYVGTSPESADEAAGAVIAELARIAIDGVPADELVAAKQQLKGQITLSLETPSARMYRAAGLELYEEPFRSLDEMLSLVDAIDEQTVSEVCSACFQPSGQTVVSLGPAPLTIL
jgi:predicted Zn-dependent peptidase